MLLTKILQTMLSRGTIFFKATCKFIHFFIMYCNFFLIFLTQNGTFVISYKYRVESTKRPLYYQFLSCPFQFRRLAITQGWKKKEIKKNPNPRKVDGKSRPINPSKFVQFRFGRRPRIRIPTQTCMRIDDSFEIWSPRTPERYEPWKNPIFLR